MTFRLRQLERGDEEAVRRVMEAALELDRYPGFNSWDLADELQSLLGFAGPDGPIVVGEDGVVCGYASPRHDDLTVHPGFRRRGCGRRLLAATLVQAAAKGEAEISLFVPVEGPGRPFAEAMGMRYRSSLWRMQLPARVAVPAPSFPADMVARGLGEWLPLAEYVALLNAGFTGHPTPITWSEAAIEYAMSQPDYDPAGMLLLAPAADPDRPVAFVRAVPAGADAEGQLGEIRVVGVLPEWRRHGLGRELLRWGVAHLRQRGVATIQLTVEAENEHALELYRRTGFVPAVEWPHWTIRVDASVPGI